MSEQQKKTPGNRERTGSATRTKSGQFAPGCSGNPSGRPRRMEVEAAALRQMCELTPLAVEVLRGILESETAKPEIKIRAAETILDRTCGKAPSRDELLDLECSPSNIGAYMRAKKEIADLYYR